MIGSPSNPLSISSLNSMALCNGLWILDDRGSSAAADTGTALGRCVELWHRDGEPKDADPIVASVKLEAPVASRPFTLARWEEVEKMFRGYYQDPRNAGVVETWSLERPVRLELPAHESDSTQQPIHFLGHLDQVRRVGESLEVWDLKSGKADGLDMVNNYAFQLALYTLALATEYPRVRVGGIIRSRGYICRGKPEPGQHNTHFCQPINLDVCRTLASRIAFMVARMRDRRVDLSPGSHCSFCSAGGLSSCIPRLRFQEYSV